MKKEGNLFTKGSNRRAFLQKGALAGGAMAIGAGLMSREARAFGQDRDDRLTKGDIAILRFLAAAELIESDLWIQYNELGGLTSGVPIEVNPNQTLNPYQAALSNLDGDGPQYITSNTLDEETHANFLNAYLESKGAEPVILKHFANLPGSTASGSSGNGRLTNLMHLNVDTSWFIRYRSATNPDFGATFPQAVTITNRTAIPISDADLNSPNNPNHIQVIANTAAFHFGYIEQGGSSLYQALGRKVTSEQVLKITQAIGGDEIAHFLEWVDFSGNSVQQPNAPVSDSGLTFPDFFALVGTTGKNNPLIQPSLIFPVPCEFISKDLPLVSVIRPTDDRFAGAQATIASFTADNLFLGQPPEFFKTLKQLAEEADDARREF